MLTYGYTFAIMYDMTTVTGSKTPMAVALRSRGWREVDDPGELGECTHAHGCARWARWTHASLYGTYCTQHAYRAVRF